MIKNYNFYDTCSLLIKAPTLFENNEPFVISSVTLSELENIKTSAHKDNNIKYSARQLLHELDKHYGEYEVVIFDFEMLAPITEKCLDINNDTKILASAIWCNNHLHIDETIFFTNDLALKNIANLFFGDDSIKSIPEEDPVKYDGYKEIIMNDEDMEFFYSNLNKNIYDLLPNEYLIIYNKENQVVDTLKWNGTTYDKIVYGNLNSTAFGNIKPIKGDIYQSLFIDSLLTNKITMVKGPAGSGKTFLSLAFLFSQLDKKIDKIIVFCNTIATKNSAKLGYYPGTRDEKLLDSQIGNLLSSKLGGRLEVERLIDQEKLVLLPLSDIRGYDTTGMNAGIYISEAQNMDISLMKLTLQRISEDSVCIIDGDFNAQVDDVDFAGANNGMKRASKVFRGEDVYGEVTLKNIHRSRIAEIAEQM